MAIYNPLTFDGSIGLAHPGYVPPVHQALDGRHAGGIDRPGSSRSSGAAFSAQLAAQLVAVANAPACRQNPVALAGRPWTFQLRRSWRTRTSQKCLTGKVVSFPRHWVGGKRAGRVELLHRKTDLVRGLLRHEKTLKIIGNFIVWSDRAAN